VGGHGDTFLCQVIAQFSSISGFEPDLNQLGICLIGQRLGHFDILVIVHLEHGDVGGNARPPMLEDFVVTEHACIELANIVEIIGLHHKVCDADDRRSFRAKRGQQREQQQKSFQAMTSSRRSAGVKPTGVPINDSSPAVSAPLLTALFQGVPIDSR
jgi:hypothetical protein